MHSPEELIKRAQRALTHVVIRVVENTQSPNAADATLRAAEYPNQICTAARYLAILRETDLDQYKKLIAPILCNQETPHSDFLDPRIFDCGWSSIGSEDIYENQGTVEVTPKENLPPLFWDYNVCDDRGITLVSTIKPKTPYTNRNIKGIFAEGSQSIPIGLKFRVWMEGSIEIEFITANQFRKIVWSRRIHHATREQKYTREASRSDHITRGATDNIQLELSKSVEPPFEKSCLIFSRNVCATGWEGQSFSCDMRMSYHFTFSPNSDMGTTSRTTNNISGRDQGLVVPVIMTAKKDDSNLQQGYHTFLLNRAIGEMVSTPNTINVKKTLANCFSFKFQEIEMLKCLAS